MALSTRHQNNNQKNKTMKTIPKPSQAYLETLATAKKAAAHYAIETSPKTARKALLSLARYVSRMQKLMPDTEFTFRAAHSDELTPGHGHGYPVAVVIWAIAPRDKIAHAFSVQYCYGTHCEVCCQQNRNRKKADWAATAKFYARACTTAGRAVRLVRRVPYVIVDETITPEQIYTQKRFQIDSRDMKPSTLPQPTNQPTPP